MAKRRRRNVKRRTVVIAAVSTVAVAAAVTGVVLWRRRKKKGEICWTTETGSQCCSYPGQSLPICSSPQGASAPAPQPSAPEPEEGWEARWTTARNQAIRLCRADDEVTSWPQAVTCVLSTVFPESGPWNDPSTWAPWMQEAALGIEEDMRQMVANEYATNDPTGWQGLLWIAGDRVAKHCAAAQVAPVDLAPCIAIELYPTMLWPPVAESPVWTHDFYKEVRKFAFHWTPPKKSSLQFPHA